jgi:hypothetical protein
MSKQHPNVKSLREFNRWSRDGETPQPSPQSVGEVLEWAIKVCEAADNLINIKGRHHSEVAYRRLEHAVSGESE